MERPPARLQPEAVAAPTGHKDLAGRAALAPFHVEQGEKPPAVLEEDDGLSRQLEGDGLVLVRTNGGFHVGKVVQHVQRVVEEADPFFQGQDARGRGVDAGFGEDTGFDLVWEWAEVGRGDGMVHACRMLGCGTATSYQLDDGLEEARLHGRVHGHVDGGVRHGEAHGLRHVLRHEVELVQIRNLPCVSSGERV